MSDVISGSAIDVVEPVVAFDTVQPRVIEEVLYKDGPPGPGGRGIASIARTSGTGAPGTTDTYRITYTDATTSTFTVANGANGANGTNGRSVTSVARTSGTGAPGTTDTYTVTFSDATTSTFTVTNGANGTNGTNGTNGRAIASIARTSGTGAAGTTDTYTITYSDATTSTFTVTNGRDGDMPLVASPVAGRLAQVNAAGQVENSPLDASTVAAQIGDLYAAVDGRVVGPAASTDDAIARFDATTGKLVQNSAVTIDDSGNIAGVKSLATTPSVGTAAGRFGGLPAIEAWVGTFLNAQFNGTAWVLDDTTKPGWFFKLDSRASSPEFAVYRIPAGANPHTDEAALLKVDVDGVMTVTNRITGVANATTNTDAIPLGQADGRYATPASVTSASTADRNRANHTGTQAFTTLTGTATAAQIGTGTPAAGKYVDGGTGAWTALPASGGGAGLLAWVQFTLAANTTTTSTTSVDVDATNLAVTFTAPASGKVLVRLTASAFINSGTNGYVWGLRQGTTNVGTAQGVLNGTTSTQPIRVSAAFMVTGLTAGTAYTYKWAHLVGGSTDAGIHRQTGSSPATMEVWSA